MLLTAFLLVRHSMRRGLIYLILCSLLTACMGSQMRQELHRVDSLNRCDVPLDTITTMPDVVDYFDTWGSANERMTAHYLLGRVFHDQGNGPVALRCYHDAVGYADTTAADCDFRRLSRIYGQMADLFNRQRAPRLEIDAERKAVEYAWRAKDTLAAITFYGYLAAPYHMLNDMDSALYYNLGAYSLFKAHHHPDYAAGILPTSIDILLRQKAYVKAKQAIDEYRSFISGFDSTEERTENFYYVYLGDYYLGVGQVDSAEFYYRSLTADKSIDHKQAVYGGLLSLYQHKGVTDSIAKYATLYCQYNDSASFAHSADEITRAQALYNYEEHERIAIQKKKEADRYRNSFITLFVILFLLGYTTYLYIGRQKRKQLQELRIANTAYSSLLAQYNQASQELTLSQQGWDSYRTEKEKEIQRLQHHLSLYQEASEQIEKWNAEWDILHSPVVNEFHHLASVVKIPSNLQWQELRQFVQDTLPDFYSHLNQSHYGLTVQEIKIGALTRLQFIPTEQAALLDVSKQRITNLRGSLNQKLFGEKGTKNLNNHIFQL